MSADPQFTRLLERIFDWYNREDKKTLSAAEYQQRKFDFVFHMTDWLADLEWLTELRHDPEDIDVKDAGRKMIGFFSHVIPHLRAAGRAYLEEEVPDPFVDFEETRKKQAKPPRKKAKTSLRSRA